jgi:aarF domain-containing kinase
MHLAIIFIPVVAAVPAIWIGRKVQDHDNARTGTLWWYRFLVKAMERAGPAFIKVSSPAWQAVYCVLT